MSGAAGRGTAPCLPLTTRPMRARRRRGNVTAEAAAAATVRAPRRSGRHPRRVPTPPPPAGRLVPMLEAGAWALFAASSLVLAAFVAQRVKIPVRTIGEAMGFGAGA